MIPGIRNSPDLLYTCNLGDYNAKTYERHDATQQVLRHQEARGRVSLFKDQPKLD